MLVAFRPDGRVLATGGYEGGLHLWDTRTWQPIGEIAHDSGRGRLPGASGRRGLERLGGQPVEQSCLSGDRSARTERN
jgi:WD40 repeat protein